MKLVTSLLSGVLFGLGLILSGMTDPSKVIGFLDLAGSWDPSLALVMGGAIAVGLVAFQLARQRKRSLLGEPMQLPSGTRIDQRLVIGALLFGVGWGLAGYCPGPALASVATGASEPIIFVLAMFAGMVLVEAIAWARSRQRLAERSK